MTLNATSIVAVTDGTNISAVKAGSTPAVATDPALVVAVSPNNTVAMVPQADALPATVNITAQDVASTSTLVANSQYFVTGAPTANSAASFTFATYETVRIQVTGTWTGTLAIESSLDGGTTWTATNIYQTGTNYVASNFIANFIGGLNVSGTTNFRVRSTAAWTGTATVKIIESLNNNSLYLSNPVSLTSSDGFSEQFGNGRMQVSQNTLLFWDNFEGSSVTSNFDRWVYSLNTMTIGGGSFGDLLLNNSATVTSVTYAVASTVKSFVIVQDCPLYFSASLTLSFPATNTSTRFGFGTVVNGRNAPLDGIYFAVVNGVTTVNVKYNGQSVDTVNLPVQLVSGITARFTIMVTDAYTKFAVQSLHDNSVITSIVLPNNNGGLKPFAFHQPAFFSTSVTTSTATTAPTLEISNVTITQLDLNTTKSWAQQMSGSGYSAILDQNTFVQSANYTNSAAPASATLSNTAASYTTLGGLFQFAAVTGAETDYALFAYLVPTGIGTTSYKDLIVYSVKIDAFVTGAANSVSPTILQWAVGINSNAVSLAVGGNTPPIIVPIGMQQTSSTAVIGTNFSPGPIMYEPTTPFVIHPGRYLHIILRIPVGNNTGAQIIRGYVSIDGIFDT